MAIKNENIVDWLYNKKGQVIRIPKFGDQLTAKEILCTAVKKKVVKKRIKTPIKSSKVIKTTLLIKGNLIELNKHLTTSQITRKYPTASTVKWEYRDGRIRKGIII